MVFRFLVVALLVGGCSSGSVCDKRSRCRNATAPSQDVIDTCKRTEMGQCGSKYQAYANCFWANEICKTDGTSDEVATQAMCLKEQTAAQTCVK